METSHITIERDMNKQYYVKDNSLLSNIKMEYIIPNHRPMLFWCRATKEMTIFG